MDFTTLPTDRKYRTLVIDPPWRYDDNLPGKGRGSAKHYSTMGMTELFEMMFDVLPILETNAHIWCWATNSFMAQAHVLVGILDATPKTILTWCKPQIRMGRYLRNSTEHCVLGVRGKLPSIDEGRNIPSHFVSPRGKHSEKPDAAYKIIERISPAPRLDMFARAPHEGFDRWGDELT